MRTDWEHGTIRLSPKDFNKFRLKFLNDYNKQLQEEMVNANNLANRVLRDWDYVINPVEEPKAPKGKDKPKGKPEPKPEPRIVNYYEYALPLIEFYRVDRDTFEKLFGGRKHGKSKAKKVKPNKDPHFSPPVPLTEQTLGKAAANQVVFNIDNYSTQLSFSKKKKTVTWTVSENVGAVKSGRDSELGRLFFASMNAIEWEAPYGGVIIGNDSEHIGENYITYTFK